MATLSVYLTAAAWYENHVPHNPFERIHEREVKHGTCSDRPHICFLSSYHQLHVILWFPEPSFSHCPCHVTNHFSFFSHASTSKHDPTSNTAAGETLDKINEEIEMEKAEKTAAEGEDEDDGIMREIMGTSMPQWLIGFQLSLQAADQRVNAMIEEEYLGRVWNYTAEELKSSPGLVDPATQPSSPEVLGANLGFDFGASICDGLVLSPALFGAYLRYADPLYKVDLDSGELSVMLTSASPTEEGSDTSYTVSRSDLLIAVAALRARLQLELENTG